jgi:hypothetical protein
MYEDEMEEGLKDVGRTSFSCGVWRDRSDLIREVTDDDGYVLRLFVSSFRDWLKDWQFDSG